MTINPLQAVFPNLSYIASADSFFDTVKEEYTAFKSDGYFNKTAQEGLYIYRIIKQGRSYTGIIGSATVADYKNGNIKRHENTIAAKEQQQMNLLLRRSAMVKPILLTYEPVKSINQFIERYIKKNRIYFEVGFEEEGSVHQIWAITNGQDIQKLQNLFAKHVPHTYIADGHHRTSTTALMNERHSNNPDGKKYDTLLSALFTVDNLQVLDFNRIIEHIDGYTSASFMVKLTEYFRIKVLDKARKPKIKHEITMQMGEEWFSLKWRKKIIDKHRNETAVLDVSLLNQYILKDVLGVENVRTDLRIKYVEGAKGVKGMKSKTSKQIGSVGFMMYPVDINDIMAVADANESLPPKSTWFEPRMKNGLLVLEF